MVSFRVRAESLGEVASHLQTVIAVFDAAAAQANTSVNGVVNASWQGEDADYFAEQWVSWNATALTVRTALTSLASQLVAAEASYTTNESGLTGGFVQRRQANQQAVTDGELVSDRIETGQELASAREVKAAKSGSVAMAASIAKGGGSSTGVQGRPATDVAPTSGTESDV